MSNATTNGVFKETPKEGLGDKVVGGKVYRMEFFLVDEPISKSCEDSGLTYEELADLAKRFPAPQEWYEE